MGYWVSRVAGYLLSVALSQGGQHRGFLEGGSEKESKAKDFKESVPLIYCLLVYGNIVGPVLKRLFNKSNGNSFEFNISGIRGDYSSWAESNFAGFKMSRSEGARLA